jgi:predicted nucleic acid-binding protein
MIVVADTSPLNYLVLIDEINLLPAIFGQVLLPQAVFQELGHPKTSPRVRQWVADLPAWLEVRTVVSVADAGLLRLDPGEREAIQLALELG